MIHANIDAFRQIEELMTTAIFMITTAPEADSSQLTQGGSKVRRSCQSTIVGTAWFEKEDFKIGI